LASIIKIPRYFFRKNIGFLGAGYFTQRFLEIIKYEMGNKGKALECCSGIGIIGLTLLKNNLCDSVDFCDIDPRMNTFIKIVGEENNIKANYKFVLSDALDQVHDKYDLIICSPPWYNKDSAKGVAEHVDKKLWQDKDWKFHKKFYQSVENKLKNRGDLLISNSYDSVHPDFWNNFTSLKRKKIFTFKEESYIIWWRNEEKV